MNAPASAVADRLTPLRLWWGSIAARERRALWLAAGLVGLALTWLVAVQPAWRTLRTVPAERATLESQLQAMHQLAAEAAELRAAPPISVEQSTAALQAASERLGERGRLSLQGDRAVLTLNGVGTAALGEWLSEVRAGARARPLEASLTRGAQGYSGNIVVAIGGTR